MLYRNIQTGMIQDFSCTISGKAWEPVKTPVPVAVDEKEAPEKPQKKKKVVE